MYSHLLGKVALITGSTSGIGLAVAKVLAASGTHVVLNGFGDANAIEKIRSEISSLYKVNALYDPADLTDPNQIRQMIERIGKNVGPIQILINNAGMQHISPIESFDDNVYDKVIALNLSSNFHTIKGCVPMMKKLGWGRIINVASVHGCIASVNKSAYVASKHAVIGLTKTVALELAQTEITCNAVCPGWVMTDLIKHQIDQRAQLYKVSSLIKIVHQISFAEAQRKLLEEKQPSIRAVEPEDLAQTVKFLCSQAAREIRGIALNVDGGWIAQ